MMNDLKTLRVLTTQRTHSVQDLIAFSAGDLSCKNNRTEDLNSKLRWTYYEAYPIAFLTSGDRQYTVFHLPSVAGTEGYRPLALWEYDEIFSVQITEFRLTPAIQRYYLLIK